LSTFMAKSWPLSIPLRLRTRNTLAKAAAITHAHPMRHRG
jgi:hypothetical protein